MQFRRLIVCAAAVAAYINTLSHAFVYDDIWGIVSRTEIAAADIPSLMRILRLPARAFLLWTYGLTFYFAGFDPFVFHLTNVLIHAVNSLLVFEIARRLTNLWMKDAKTSALPFAAGLIHALHPFYTEAVAYVWGRSSLLCATFYFGALLLVIVGREKRNCRDAPRILKLKNSGCVPAIPFLLGAILCGFLAWKTKEEAITLPLLVASFFFIDGVWIAGLLLVIAPAVVVLFSWTRLMQVYYEIIQNTELTSVGLEPALPAGIYALTQLKASVSYYLWHFIFPIGLNADPDVKTVMNFVDPAFLFSLAVLITLATGSFMLAKRRPLPAFALAAILISPLTFYAAIPLRDVVAEHRAYIAGLGVDLIAAWVLTRRRRVAIPIMAGLAVILGGLTIQRNGVWKDSLTLWTDTEKKAPNRLRPHLNLGETYQSIGANDLAIREYQHALALQPNLTPVYVNLGAIHLSRGAVAVAEPLFHKALELSPNLIEPLVNLAIIRIRQGQGSAALEYVERAAALNPMSYLVHFTRGDVLMMLGRYEEAKADYREAIQLRPDLKDVQEQVQRRLAQIEAVQRGNTK